MNSYPMLLLTHVIAIVVDTCRPKVMRTVVVRTIAGAPRCYVFSSLAMHMQSLLWHIPLQHCIGIVLWPIAYGTVL
jgi:hypothetical protein